MKSFQNKISPFFVHLFTGSGIIFSFLALLNVIEGNKLQTFMFLGIALVIDIVDGTLARKYKTEIFFPNIDGKTLDTIIDYINYIFIPAIMLYKFNYLPQISANIQKCNHWFKNSMNDIGYEGKYYYSYCTKSNHFS